MEKDVIIVDSLNKGKELYQHIKSNNNSSKRKIKYISNSNKKIID